jgi:mono/diheme cytochrome c family protein
MKRYTLRGLTALAAVVLMLGAAPCWAETTAAEKEHRELFRLGARLWPEYCGSCHNPRPGGERSPAEWDVIMLHMRVRANLPAHSAAAILEYLRAR